MKECRRKAERVYDENVVQVPSDREVPSVPFSRFISSPYRIESRGLERRGEEENLSTALAVIRQEGGLCFQ